MEYRCGSDPEIILKNFKIDVLALLFGTIADNRYEAKKKMLFIRSQLNNEAGLSLE